MAYKKISFFVALFALLLFSCNIPLSGKLEKVNVNFNADSAYYFIEKQVSFGPRVPNTQAHEECFRFLKNKLSQYADTVITQDTTLLRFDQTPMKCHNIIGVFYPEKKQRIILFSHWDTRFYADQEPDSAQKVKPIDGANDGASGTAILLEIARIIARKEPEIGVDIIFFDAEDQGQPLDMKIFSPKDWALGAKAWTENPHFKIFPFKPEYLYAIGVDMAGAKNAKFFQEDYSLFYFNYLVKRIWQLAENLGYGNYFVPKYSKPVYHDHVVINKYAGIRAIMILENYRKNPPFGDYWHTHNDNLQIIDKQTLKAVGETLVNVIYNEK